MILETDPKDQYNRQLTQRPIKSMSLEFAIKQFRDDPSIHCIVYEGKKGWDEVFILGD